MADATMTSQQTDEQPLHRYKDLTGRDYSAPEPDLVQKAFEIERAEARFWQGHIIQATFWFDLGILSVVAFVLKTDGARQKLVGISGAVAVLLLTGFYTGLSWLTRSAIDECQWKLKKYDYFLGLSGFWGKGEPNVRIPREPKPGFDAKRPMRQGWLLALRGLTWVLCAGALVSIARAVGWI